MQSGSAVEISQEKPPPLDWSRGWEATTASSFPAVCGSECCLAAGRALGSAGGCL